MIKVERPEGDFARSYDTGANGKSSIFAWLNRGKESISLDLKDPKDKKLLEKILAKSDVFLSNLTLGSLKKLRLDYDQIKLINPRLISCEINGYGETKEALNSKNDILLRKRIRSAVARKPKGHDFDYTRQKVTGQMSRHMSHTGG